MSWIRRKLAERRLKKAKELDTGYAPYPPMSRKQADIYKRAMYEFCMVASPDLKMRVEQWQHIQDHVLPHVVGYVIADVTYTLSDLGGQDLTVAQLIERIEEHYGL